MENKALFWHRRDLRIEDNAGLFKALSEVGNVVPVFIFDSQILNKLNENDQRIIFIHHKLEDLKKQYQAVQSDLLVYYGDPCDLIPKICESLNISHVFTNRDYEPNAIERDKTLFTSLAQKNISFIGSKDHVIFEKSEIQKDDGKPYTIFTPYSKKWKLNLSEKDLTSYPSELHLDKTHRFTEYQALIPLSTIGFNGLQTHTFPSETCATEIISNYTEDRDYPARNGTSRLGVHLRFGTISIRSIAKKAKELNETFLNELIWREFYQMILFHFPHSASNSFKPLYDRITWDNNEILFALWCEGKTGYPLVDAGMRELNQTGHMHNRVRMIVASFLTKHLLIDWRWGAVYFAEKLLDFELASNAGGWQWAAGSGCDASPYFRIFNPSLQLLKFDKELNYVLKWVPEYNTLSYPKPIVVHAEATKRTISIFKSCLNAI